MSVTENTAKVQEQVISAIQATQETVLSAIKPFVALAEPAVDAAATLPFADQLPAPGEVVAQWYDFAAQILSTQKDFALSLAGLVGATPSTKPATKSQSTKVA